LRRSRGVEQQRYSYGFGVHRLSRLEVLNRLACPIHQGSANFEVWRNFPSPAATIRGAARGARLDFIFIG